MTAWRAIAASHAAACAALEREMGKRHGLGVSEFEVLDRLAESGFGAVEEVEVVPERMAFALPHELREHRTAED